MHFKIVATGKTRDQSKLTYAVMLYADLTNSGMTYGFF